MKAEAELMVAPVACRSAAHAAGQASASGKILDAAEFTFGATEVASAPGLASAPAPSTAIPAAPVISHQAGKPQSRRCGPQISGSTAAS